MATGSVLPAEAISFSPTCDLNNHCYAVALWGNATTNHGSSGTIEFDCLRTGNTGNKFVNEEMWQGTDSSGSGAYWVEVGGRYGWPNGDSRYWFWADNRPNGGGYFQHFPGTSISLNIEYPLSFQYDGNNDWLVLGPNFSATSTANPANGKYLAAGTEITDDTAHSAGNTRFLAYDDTSGNSIGDWSGAGLDQVGTLATPSWVGSDKSNISWITPC
jgi:hypothetical protein